MTSLRCISDRFSATDFYMDFHLTIKSWPFSLCIVLCLVIGMLGCGSGGSSGGTLPTYDQRFVAQKSYSSWSFGVMGDSQWTMPDDGMNPNSVAVEIVRQVQREFISHKVKFVVQTGDLTDLGWQPNGIGRAAIDTRALFAQELYNNDIGFYPVRGNHEGSPEASVEMQRVFPQTQGGLNNSTPSDVLAMPNPDAVRQPSPVFAGRLFYVGSNFTSPSSKLSGLSYSFDYKNSRFVLLDQFLLSDKTSASIKNQNQWISAQLASRMQGSHAFVFSHMDFDNMFAANDREGQNGFINSMSQSNTKYLISGHVHLHDRSIIYASDYSSNIQQIICASSSSKFYVPTPLNEFSNYSSQRPPLSQELKTIGYYIFTVTGPNVTVDYYSAAVNPIYLLGAYQINTVPPLIFTKKESFGYSLVGKEFVIEPDHSYDYVSDSYSSRVGALPTRGRILAGKYTGFSTNGSGFVYYRSIQTGWSPMVMATSSDIMQLWGLQRYSNIPSEPYVLSISYYPSRVDQSTLQRGTLRVATKNAAGDWIPAVSLNNSGIPAFVFGPWDASYGLGTYGVDVTSNTVWAVINYHGEFAAVQTF